MIDEGDTAPDFSLPGTDPDADEAEVGTYRLSDYTDRGNVILTFYLFDFHPECTRQVCAIRDLSWFEFLEDTTVFAVSTDKTFSHRAFAEEHGLPFTLLSDSDGTVSESYGVLYDEFKRHKRVAKRSVFVIDDDRTVRYAWSTDDAGEQPDWAEVEEATRPLTDASM